MSDDIIINKRGKKTKVNSDIQVTISLKMVITVIGIIVSIWGSIYGIINYKINKLDNKIEQYNTKMTVDITKIKEEDLKTILTNTTTTSTKVDMLLNFYGIKTESNVKTSDNKPPSLSGGGMGSSSSGN